MIDDGPFADTSVSALVFSTIDKVRAGCMNAAIVGAAGVGKTRALNAYIAKNPSVRMITVTDVLGRAPKELWSQICFDILGSSAKSTATTQDWLFEHNLSGGVFIFDEAQNLPPVQMREILHLHDRSRMSIVFCGNMEVLHRSQSRKGAWDQINSRLDIFEPIDGLLDEDADALAESFGVDGEGAYRLVRAIGERFYARGVARVLHEAHRRANGGLIKEAHIRSAIDLFSQYRVVLKSRPEAIQQQGNKP